MTLHCSDEEEEFGICKRSQECLNYSWQPYLQDQGERTKVTSWNALVQSWNKEAVLVEDTWTCQEIDWVVVDEVEYLVDECKEEWVGEPSYPCFPFPGHIPISQTVKVVAAQNNRLII